MSRIGRMPINLAKGVEVKVADGNLVTVKGPLGTLTQQLHPRMTIKVEAGVATVVRPTDEQEDKALHGLTRALLNDMVVGVTEGYTKTLQIVGVGYKVVKQGKTLQLFLGQSLMANGLPQATLQMTEPEGIKFETPDSNTIVIKGCDKQQVGQIASVIRSKRPPEPYHGKGVKYAEEHIRRKAGKAGKGKK